ncbi:MAG TPA: YqgE/AlgH family protein [Kiritimatiellia bacterium]|nr:YqgE/AlgH family protein [Kiritimatiellia bacterium]
MAKTPKSLKGKLLVARPGLIDPNFAQTIVYMVEHSPEGALGFVLNRPVGASLADCVSEESTLPFFREVPVLQGGPVHGGRIAVVVFVKPPRAKSVRALCGMDVDQLQRFIGNPRAWVRAFHGYAGWDAGQLERELTEDSWLVRPVDPTVFDPRIAPGLWSFLLSGDDRWRALVDYLPKESDRN